MKYEVGKTYTVLGKIVGINEVDPISNINIETDKKRKLNLKFDYHIIHEFKLNETMEFTFIVEEQKDKEINTITNFESIYNLDISSNELLDILKLFYKFSPVDIEENNLVIKDYLDEIENKIIKDIVESIYFELENKFKIYPAASSYHHAYIGGLAYHTRRMLDAAKPYLSIYPYLNKDLVYAGIILHDIYKCVELSSAENPEYTTEGQLIGHITLGIKAVNKLAIKLGYERTEEVLLLEHMILSHHYHGNYGSPKKPMFGEAILVHFIDNIDSKLTVVGEVLEDVNKGKFSQPVPVMDRMKMYKHGLFNKKK